MDNSYDLLQNNDRSLHIFQFEHIKEHSFPSGALFDSAYHAYLAVKGKADMRLGEKDYLIESGSLFFVYPNCIYIIEASEEFECFHISFSGEGVSTLLSDYGVSVERCVFGGLEELNAFFGDVQKRVCELEDLKISKSVLLYSLVLISHNNTNVIEPKKNNSLFDEIINYISIHYRDVDISVKKLSQIFFYTEKHITTVFRKNMGISFKKYIRNQRIEFAQALIKNGESSVTEISRMCGYSDPLYFSKVFSRECGISPRDAIKKRKELNN